MANSLLNTYVNGAGLYDFFDQYWMGGVAMNREVSFFNAILVDPTLTSADKAATKAVASLFAYMLYDDDFVPLDGFISTASGGNGLNAGTANMPIQELGYRDDYALFIPQHQLLQPFASSVIGTTDQALSAQVSVEGASASSPHYTGASVEPTLDTLLQALMAGTDYFASDNPRLTRFGEFLMQLSTPPEVRFEIGTNAYLPTPIPRKMVEEGDGSTEGTELTGVAAQGFRNADPALEARLMGAWIQGGKVHSGFFATTLCVIDENAPWVDPHLGSDNFPGYMSVLRNGWGTDQESAAWLFNGDYLSSTGHRHDDRGNVVLYSLGAPLTVNWGSFYTPPSGGGNMTSIVMPAAGYSPVAWNGDGQALNYNSGWTSSTNDAFEAFTDSSMANAKMANGSGLNWSARSTLSRSIRTCRSLW